jgi:hypothetical protein
MTNLLMGQTHILPLGGPSGFCEEQREAGAPGPASLIELPTLTTKPKQSSSTHALRYPSALLYVQ